MSVEIWSIPLEAPAEVVCRLFATLSVDERQRACRYATELLRARFIVGRGALRMLLGARLRCPPSSIVFDYGRAGKPFVCGRPVVFNVSHSGSLAVAAISDCPHLILGIDVEAVRALPDLHDIARRFFAPRERDELAALERPLQTEAFFNCWTRKEAYLKAVGDGLLAPLDRFEVTLRPGERSALRHIDGNPATAADWRIHHFSLPGHIGALVHRGEAVLGPWREFDVRSLR